MSDLSETIRSRAEEAFQAVEEAKVARWIVRPKTTTLTALNGEPVHRLDGGKNGPWHTLMGQAGSEALFGAPQTPTEVTEHYRARGWVVVGPIPGV